MPTTLDTPPRSSSPFTASSSPSLRLQSSNSSFDSADAPLPPAETAIRQREHHESDVLVVGAGIFGCAVAITLARQGRSVTLLERKWEAPDRIVGELLQPGGVTALQKLGLGHCLEDIDAVRVLGYDVIFYGEGVRVAYPRGDEDQKTIEDVRLEEEQSAQGGSGPAGPEGRSFHHGRFIGKLREAVVKEENILVVESTATEMVKDGTSGQVLGMEALTKGQPDYYFAQLTIICDGYASKFRAATSTPSSSSKFYALALHDAVLPSPLHGHVILSAAPPTLLYQISSHTTRALVDVPATCPTASVAAGGVKNHLRNVILPALPESVRPSFEKALDEGKLRSMPNSFLPPHTQTTPGLCILGDAMNMRHPLTGGGMTVALNDVVLLRELLAPERITDLGDTKAVREAMKSFHWRRKGLSSVINILAMALYALFAADDDALRTLQNGCFRYFQLGGACVSGPVGLLAGLIRQPLVLFYHFFSVAMLGMWLFIVEGPPSISKLSAKKDTKKTIGMGDIIRMPGRAVMSLAVFWKACLVLFPYIFSELRG